jgi:hypothetical protein
MVAEAQGFEYLKLHIENTMNFSSAVGKIKER